MATGKTKRRDWTFVETLQVEGTISIDLSKFTEIMFQFMVNGNIPYGSTVFLATDITQNPGVFFAVYQDSTYNASCQVTTNSARTQLSLGQNSKKGWNSISTRVYGR